jgi:DNA-binding NtrC family response regulator
MVKPTTTSITPGYLILLLLNTHSQFLVAFLQRNGYAVAEAHSPDQLVALCSSNPVHAVIMDACQLGEIEGWSVAQSVKVVNPTLSVILLCHGPKPEVDLPTAVDALASDSDLSGLLSLLGKHVTPKAAAHS